MNQYTPSRDRRDELQWLVYELLDVKPRDCFLTIESRGFGVWWLRYKKPRYAGDIGIKLGRYDQAKIKLQELLGDE